ncbi:hypothetical protein ACH5RR_009288 [Cinchona calisaya]|uniref:Pentatricopeptide repeat-containing protein n=1 Tax=Cinchona calisaya TaxID=153742 RepID=A0ABD3ADS3_9GENT
METVRLFSLLKSCINQKSLTKGRLLHQKVIILGLQNNIGLCKNLINLYTSCHEFHSAKLVFQTIKNPLDISLWNGLMAAYTKNFMFNEAFELYEKLLNFPYLRPDSYTYPSVIKACSGLKRVELGRMIHGYLLKVGFLSDVVVISSMVGMYAKCDLFGAAVQLFDEMLERDIVSWNSVMSCYYQSGQYEKALESFEKMKRLGFKPNSVTFTSAISSCGRLMDLERGTRIHQDLIGSGFVLDDFVSTALVDMYGKCGCLEKAKEVFEQIEKKSLVAWNVMISGYGLRGDSKSCIELLLRLNEEKVRPSSTTLTSLLMACSKSAQLQHGKFVHGYIIRNNVETDIIVSSSLIDLYFKCGNVVPAERIFCKMAKNNVMAWNVMISGYVSVGCYFDALDIFNKMKEVGIKPDAITFTSILASCTQLAALEQGKEIHKFVVESKLESNEIVMGALLDMYAKCGAVNEALFVFNQLPQRDLVSWTSMIVACGSHGQAYEALKLFGEMLHSNVMPDRVSFLAVISACSHAGLVDDGYHYFNLMVNDYKIQPTIEDYSCLIDLLGRAGRLHEAYGILQRIPCIREDVALLSTLFWACHVHGEEELGEKIAGFLMQRDLDDPSIYTILANMYASNRKWDMARKFRMKMKEIGIRKNPGCSWIEVDKRIQPFFVDGNSFPLAKKVYKCLSIISSHMEKDEMLYEWN